MTAEARFESHATTPYAPLSAFKWPGLVVTRESIDEEVERLADAELSETGLRLSRIVHPSSTGPGRGFAPGIDVSINVVRPGEASPPFLTNATYLGFCLSGDGEVTVGSRTIQLHKWSVWTVPSMRAFRYVNTGTELLVFLTYSNIPLLEKMCMHFFENPAQMRQPLANAPANDAPAVRARDLALNTPIGDMGGRILGYEYCVDIDVVPSEAMVWQWKDVIETMNMTTDTLPRTYDGRRVGILYDPATGRLNGTTNALFAAFGQKEPYAADHFHRHSSCSINYYLAGGGNSIVDDQYMEWKAGDLQFAAPAWSAHRHASGPAGLRALTVQDHPFMIGMDALIWQEHVEGPVLRLGGDVGAETNLVKALAAA